MSEILIAKQQSIEHCLKRARSAWDKPSKLPLQKDYNKQDIVILNLQRACEQTLDLANHTIRAKKLGWPKNSAESFALLNQAGIIDAELEKKLIAMVGFKNIAVHQYQDIDYRQVEEVVKNTPMIRLNLLAYWSPRRCLNSVFTCENTNCPLNVPARNGRLG